MTRNQKREYINTFTNMINAVNELDNTQPTATAITTLKQVALTDVDDPTSAQDVATKNYVDENSPILTATASSEGTGVLTRTYVTAQGTATAANTFNIATQVPSGAKIVGAQLRVDVLLSADTGVSWAAAYNTGSTASLGSGKAFTKNTKVNVHFNENASTAITTAATDITVTCNAGNFIAGGKITAIVYYEQFTTMTSAV